MKLSLEQKEIFDAIIEWYNNQSIQTMTVGGFAGCGKTFLITKLAEYFNKEDISVAYACYTGKAANVLRQKMEIEIPDIYTIHKLIYYSELITTIDEDGGRENYWENTLKKYLPYDLIIVDEASMVSKYLYDDLLSFGLLVLFIGDHGQLPPVADTFNLMDAPKYKLEKIHRQAEGNPIIKWSMWAREGVPLPFETEITALGTIKRIEPQSVAVSVQSTLDISPIYICGRNKTRHEFNTFIRQRIFKQITPVRINDIVICLKNSTAKGTFNGQIGKVLYVEEENIKDLSNPYVFIRVELENGEIIYEGDVLKAQFGFQPNHNFKTIVDYIKLYDLDPYIDLFDFGYCITVHKAQGSQAPNVVLFNENIYKKEPELYKRWLYTGITRAEKNLLIIG